MPSLTGFGTPQAGNTLQIMMAEGAANGTGLLFLSTSAGNQELAGCTILLGELVGAPISFHCDANRQAQLGVTLAAPLPSGISAFRQIASLDGAAPNGVLALSNGLELRLP